MLGYARRRHRASAPLVLNPQGLEEFGATDPSRARLKRAAYLPLRRAVLACAAAADAVIATDRALQPVVLEHLKVPATRVRIIPNALDLPAIDALTSAGSVADLRQRERLSPDEIVLFSAGRLEENKGFHVLLQALATAGNHGGLEQRRWRWVCAGDGPYRRSLEALASSLSILGSGDLSGTHQRYRDARLARDCNAVRAPHAV